MKIVLVEPPGRLISIHALREEGDYRRCQGCCCKIYISIHALREEGDGLRYDVPAVAGYISIHALREEGDLPPQILLRENKHFYPRPPRGGRRINARTCTRVICNFYPRPPRGGRLLVS